MNTADGRWAAPEWWRRHLAPLFTGLPPAAHCNSSEPHRASGAEAAAARPLRQARSMSGGWLPGRADQSFDAHRLDRPGQALVQGDHRLPAKQISCERDVRTADLRIVNGQRLMHDLRRRVGSRNYRVWGARPPARCCTSMAGVQLRVDFGDGSPVIGPQPGAAVCSTSQSSRPWFMLSRRLLVVRRWLERAPPRRLWAGVLRMRVSVSWRRCRPPRRTRRARRRVR